MNYHARNLFVWNVGAPPAEALDLTQAALAQRVGCAEGMIRELETDVFRPSREMAERLPTCLDLPADERTAFLQTARGGQRRSPPHAAPAHQSGAAKSCTNAAASRAPT